MQIVNVTVTDLTIEARVSLGVGYPLKPDSQMVCSELEEWRSGVMVSVLDSGASGPS